MVDTERLYFQEEVDRQRKLPDQERIDFINSEHWINYTQAQNVLTKLTDLIRLPKRNRMPNLLMLSPTNNGKTMLIKRFMYCYPPKYKPKVGWLDYMDQHDYYDELSILYIQMPSHPDLKRFYGLILHSLGVPISTSVRAMVLESMVLKFLAHLKTKMLIIDELHNVLSGRVDLQREFLNLLRFLGNQLEIPIVAIGIKEAYLVIRSDDQLENRFNPYILPEWKYDQEYLSLLATYNKILPLKYSFDLTQPVIAKKIFGMSDGKIGEICAVIRNAAIRGIRSFKETINEQVLEQIEYKSPTERRQQLERILNLPTNNKSQR